MRLGNGGMGPRGAGPITTPAGGSWPGGQAAGWLAAILAWLAAVFAVYAWTGWVEAWVLAPPAGVLAARRWGLRAGGLVAAAALLAMALALVALPPDGRMGWRLLIAQVLALAGAWLGARLELRLEPHLERGRDAGGAARRPVGAAAGRAEGAPARGEGGGAGSSGEDLTESELQALYACTHTLNKVTSVDDLIREFNNLLSARLGYPYLALLLVQPDGSLKLASAPLYPEEVQGLVLPRGRGICSAVAETGEPVIVDDVTQDPRYYPGLREARSQIAVPVQLGGQVVGVLSVESPLVAAFTPRDLRLLQAIADEVAVALERARLMERVEQQAITDSLTGLYNRTYLIQRLREEGERAARYRRPLSLLFIDVDDLKLVNDWYGHDAGDRVLVRLGRILREVCRSVDYAARYGGDEFVVVLPETGPEGAMAVAARIQERLREEPALRALPGGRRVGASIGIAAYPAHARDWTELLRLADQAMYGAKRRAKAGRPGRSGPGAAAVAGDPGDDGGRDGEGGAAGAGRTPAPPAAGPGDGSDSGGCGGDRGDQGDGPPAP